MVNIMVGYLVLDEKDSEALLAQKLQPIHGVDDVTFNRIIGVRAPVITKNLFYYVDPVNNLIIVTTPINAAEFGELLTHLDNYFSKIGLANKQLLLSLTGRGVTEKHVVTAYCSAGRQNIQIFDSKASNPSKFFSSLAATQLGTLVLSLFRSLVPSPRQTITLSDASYRMYPDNNQLGQNRQFTADYTALGTQSFFDGVSCGYHSAATILICRELIAAGEDINRENILARTNNPVNEATILLKETNPKKVNNAFFAFMKKAWFDTVMPLGDEKEREASYFRHYFLGWPKEGSVKKALYLVFLGFIFFPLINSIRRPLEFTLNAFSEVANLAKNQLIAWAPTTPGRQYLRSALILLAYGFQGLFTGTYLLLRTVTSPITSFKAAQQINNPVLRTMLSVLSVILSFTAFAALAYFAAPAVLIIAAPSTATALTPILTALAYPFSQLFALMGISLAPVTAAVATVITSSALFAVAKEIVSKVFSKSPEKNDSSNLQKKPSKDLLDEFEEDEIVLGSNVSSILAKQPVLSKSKDLKEDTLKEGSFTEETQRKILFSTATEKPVIREKLPTSDNTIF